MLSRTTFRFLNNIKNLNFNKTNSLYTQFFKSFSTNTPTFNPDQLHPSQKDALTEQLILVDENDIEVGKISKINGHLKSMNNKYPHRAFSVFLFNMQNELLLQQRASSKFTFADYWSNTCCSHPIQLESEIVTENNIGVRRAAVRRMNYELGIQTNVKDYYLMEKILYRADSDAMFEEFEVDYILLAKMDMNTEQARKLFNRDEVEDVMFMSKDSLKKSINELTITPWFKLIMENKIDEIFEKGVRDEIVYTGKENDIVRYI